MEYSTGPSDARRGTSPRRSSAVARAPNARRSSAASAASRISRSFRMLPVYPRSARERIAGPGIAAVEAALEPGDALLGAAVGELLRHDTPGAEALEAIVADGAGGAQRVVHVAGIELHLAGGGAA